MRAALTIASFVVLVVHGIVFYDQFFHKWEKHQDAYFSQALSQARTPQERAELESRAPRIEQIIVTQFGEARVDRCTTCHIAYDDPRFKDHFHPLKTHPYSSALGDAQRDGRWERRHKFSDFGCTVCHDGQGRGLDTVYSHGQDVNWPEPLLGYVAQANWRFKDKLFGQEYMEANCAQGHTGEGFAGTPNLNLGRQLFFRQNCYGCHRIEGMSEGTLAPDLTEVGKKWKLDYLWESIVDPRANLATSFMPKFKLTDSEVKALTIFLKSRRGRNFNETSLARYRARLEETRPASQPPAAAPQPSAAVSAADLRDRGAGLLRDRACTACHKLGASDGGIAPELTFEGLLKDEAWILQHFKNPRSLVPDSIMPAFRFPEDDFRSLSAYLAGLDVPPPPMNAADTFRTLCSRCHGEKGDGNGLIAPYLDPAPRDLTKASFINSKPPSRFLNSIRGGVGGTSMPVWGKVLDESRAQEVLAYVAETFVREPRRALTVRNLPERDPVSASPESVARGEQIFLRRCTGCHGRKADGKGPNSLDIVPRPRNLRNAQFIGSIGDRRLFESILYGVQGTAMPAWIDYGLQQSDVGDLINFIRSLNARR